MPDHCLPKQLLVSAPVGGKRAVGGQKRRWNDVVATDVNQCNLSGGWKEQAQDSESWRTTIKHSAELLNEQAEIAEKCLKDQKKKLREMSITESENALHYDSAPWMLLPGSDTSGSDQPPAATPLQHSKDSVQRLPPTLPSTGIHNH
jgi:hypothetical protein